MYTTNGHKRSIQHVPIAFLSLEQQWVAAKCQFVFSIFKIYNI